MPRTTLHVLDGTALLFRAYFGMNKVAAPDGREIGGVLGFCQSLSRFLRTVRPTHVAVAEALGFCSYKIPGFEADDLMATMAHRGSRAGSKPGGRALFSAAIWCC